MNAARPPYQEDVALSLVGSAKGVLPPTHAVVDEEAHGKDVHALALALPLSAVLMPQLLWRLPAQTSTCTCKRCNVSGTSTSSPSTISVYTATGFEVSVSCLLPCNLTVAI